MAGLTSREGEAIRKALDHDTMVGLSQKVVFLEREIQKEVGFNEYRAREATRILEPKKDVTGKEIRPTGSLFENMVRGLDESGLISALTAVRSVAAVLEAKKKEWVLSENIREDEAGFLPGRKFDKETLNNMTMSS